MAKKGAITKEEVDEFKIVKPNEFTAKIFDEKVSRILKRSRLKLER